VVAAAVVVGGGSWVVVGFSVVDGAGVGGGGCGHRPGNGQKGREGQ